MHLISFSWTLKQFKKQSEKSWLMEYLECNIYNNTFHNKLMGVQILPEVNYLMKYQYKKKKYDGMKYI